MTSILINLLKETFLALVAKIAFKTIFERLLTRVIVSSLRKLKDFSDNDVLDETIDDILAMLKGKRLKVIDELESGNETPKL